jgi:hypothetical protein
MQRLIFIVTLIGVLCAPLPALAPVGFVTTTETMFPADQSKAAGTTVALPLRPNSVRFAVIGDSGTGNEAQYTLANEMVKVQQATDFGFVVMVGDNLYGGHSPSDYEKKFEIPYKPLLDKGVQFYASLGNHDNPNEISYAPFNMNGKRYYTFTKGSAEFFVLDSNYMDPGQLNWLRDELQKSNSEWKIAYFHHPLYSSGKRHGSDTDLRAVLEPMFIKYKVNLVLSGHDHIYERITPQNNIAYFVMGSSGQLRSNGIAKDAQEAAGFDTDRCFIVMEIAGNDLYFQAISRTGQVVDSGTVKRQPDAATAATKAPEVPATQQPH